MGRIRDKLSGTPRCPMCGGPSPGASGMCGSCAWATGTKPKNQLRTKAGRESTQEEAEMTSISEDANAAADYIEKHGWTRNRFQGSDGSVCMLGALGLGYKQKIDEANAVDDDCHYTHPTTIAITEYLGFKSIPTWNDTKAQSQEEVVQVLRDVATKHAPDEMRGGD